jgi:hypothetical protein
MPDVNVEAERLVEQRRRTSVLKPPHIRRGQAAIDADFRALPRVCRSDTSHCWLDPARLAASGKEGKISAFAAWLQWLTSSRIALQRRNHNMTSKAREVDEPIGSATAQTRGSLIV